MAKTDLNSFLRAVNEVFRSPEYSFPRRGPGAGQLGGLLEGPPQPDEVQDGGFRVLLQAREQGDHSLSLLLQGVPEGQEVPTDEFGASRGDPRPLQGVPAVRGLPGDSPRGRSYFTTVPYKDVVEKYRVRNVSHGLLTQETRIERRLLLLNLPSAREPPAPHGSPLADPHAVLADGQGGFIRLLRQAILI